MKLVMVQTDTNNSETAPFTDLKCLKVECWYFFQLYNFESLEVQMKRKVVQTSINQV